MLFWRALPCLGFFGLVRDSASQPPYAAVPRDASPNDAFALRDGNQMPIIGLGVYLSAPGEETYQAVRWALEAGYRLIDTASIYGNEESVGKAIAESGVPRKDIWVTTKLWDTHHGYSEAREALEVSLRRLKLDYIDLYLVHSPNTGKLVETWDSLRQLQKEGKIRSIGVSNYGVAHMEALRTHGRALPAVNQIEMHPLNYKERVDVLEYCQQHGILVQAYGSLFAGKVELLERPEVQKVVAAHPGRTAAQVLLRWGLQMGFQIIPKSTKQLRIQQNLEVLDFTLSEAEMATLTTMQGTLGAYWQPLSAAVDIGDTSKGHPEALDGIEL